MQGSDMSDAGESRIRIISIRRQTFGFRRPADPPSTLAALLAGYKRVLHPSALDGDKDDD